MTGGWRPLLRVARRDALRHKGRSLLIVLLVGVPVAAMSASLILAESAKRTPEQDAASTMGQADLRVTSSGVADADWQAVLPDGARASPIRTSYRAVAIVDGDELFEPEVFEADLEDPLLGGLAEVVEGRPARGTGEVVLSPALAGDLGLAVGDRLALARPPREVAVVGFGVNPFNLSATTMFVAPGWSGVRRGRAEGLDSVGWLVDVGAADDADVGEALEGRFPLPFAELDKLGEETSLGPEGAFPAGEDVAYLEVLSRSGILTSDPPASEGVSGTYVAGVLALVWTGAVAAAAFAVGARRRLREVGLVAAAGGSPRHLRRMLLADGLVLGLAGALGGVAVGLAAAVAMRPHVNRLVGYSVDDLRIPVALLAAAAAVGTLAAVLAALVPARSAARVPVLSALAGLRPTRSRARSWLAVGSVALVTGVALCWLGGGTGQEWAVNAGVLLVVFGVGASAAPVLGLVARLAAGAPLSLRLAARDAGRSRGRAGPATVAAMLALAGAIGGSTMLQSSEAQVARQQVTYFGTDQLRVEFTNAEPPPTAAEVEALQQAVLGAVPDATGGQLAAIAAPDGRSLVFVGATPALDRGDGVAASSPPPGSALAVVDDAALDVLGAGSASGAFEAGKVVAVNGGTADPGDTVTLRMIADGQVEEVATVPAVEVEGEARYGLPNFLMSSATAESLGLPSRPSAVVVRAPQAVTEADVRRVNLAVLQAVPSVPVFVQGGATSVSGGAYVLPAMLGAGALVALFVVGLVTALSREELRPHLATLAAVGAAPRTRRRLAAAQSGLLAGLAAMLAVPAGLLPAVTLLRARAVDVDMVQGGFESALSASPVVVPWLAIAALVVGVTVTATLGGGLFTRSRLLS